MLQEFLLLQFRAFRKSENIREFHSIKFFQTIKEISKFPMFCSHKQFRENHKEECQLQFIVMKISYESTFF